MSQSFPLYPYPVIISFRQAVISIYLLPEEPWVMAGIIAGHGNL